MNKKNIDTFYISTLPDFTEKIWKMRYKDEDKDSSSWQIWTSTDKPNDFLIEALKKQGMYRLEIIN